jgi:hypothetical protein
MSRPVITVEVSTVVSPSWIWEYKPTEVKMAKKSRKAFTGILTRLTIISLVSSFTIEHNIHNAELIIDNYH